MDKNNYGYEIVKNHPICSCSKKLFKYCERYDSYYCPECDHWLEPQCNCKKEDNCPYTNRPEKPSFMKENS
jgi:hypothetical protein